MPFNASVIRKINGTGSVPYVGNKHELNDMTGAYRNLCRVVADDAKVLCIKFPALLTKLTIVAVTLPTVLTLRTTTDPPQILQARLTVQS